MLLITGAAGFVGSRVCAKARDASLPVIVASRNAGEGIDLNVDLANPDEIGRMPLQDVAAVIHCAAAIPSRNKEYARDNGEATRLFADALAEASRLRRVVHLSSVSVYRMPKSGVFMLDESWPVLDADEADTGSYGLSKRTAERAFDALGERRPEVSVTHLRATSVYGRGMVKTTLLPAVAGRLARGEPINLTGSRAYTQNFVHVDDVAELALALVQNDDAFPVVNAFSDDTFGLLDLVALLRSSLSSTSPVVDETNDTAAPVPCYVNLRAKTLHPRFRSLRERIGDVL
jgi:nucleoside-diphosphate-sugar epimerase